LNFPFSSSFLGFVLPLLFLPSPSSGQVIRRASKEIGPEDFRSSAQGGPSSIGGGLARPSPCLTPGRNWDIFNEISGMSPKNELKFQRSLPTFRTIGKKRKGGLKIYSQRVQRGGIKRAFLAAKKKA
jgi:hypothetical protein